MPLYEYRCEKCGELFEVRQKFSDEPLRTHEKCGGALERLLSAPALQFKGSGWYVNDYAKGTGGSKKSDGDSKGDSKTDSSEKKESPVTSTSTTEKSSSPASSEKKPA
jgi:putative FmdB family regulatory protein